MCWGKTFTLNRDAVAWAAEELGALIRSGVPVALDEADRRVLERAGRAAP